MYMKNGRWTFRVFCVFRAFSQRVKCSNYFPLRTRTKENIFRIGKRN